MYQHTRPPPRTAASANSPQTNPIRTNNQRDQGPERSRSSLDLTAYTERGSGEAPNDPARSEQSAARQEREAAKLKQIVKNFHTKAALIIVSSRVSPVDGPGSNEDDKQNPWFGVMLNDSGILADDIEIWKAASSTAGRPAPLIVESYIDTGSLSHKERLVIVDDSGKRRPVNEMLESLEDGRSQSPIQRETSCIVLERWKIHLGDVSTDAAAEGADQLLPNVYKRGIVLMRSLYAYARMLPTWKFSRRVGRQPRPHNALKVKFRVLHESLGSPRQDTLHLPLYPDSDTVTGEYHFAPLLCPAGPLQIHLTYRTNCDFRVDASESLFSSEFMSDTYNPYFRPSWETRVRTTSMEEYEKRQRPAGSLPIRPGDAPIPPNRGQAYGSMGTFHQPELAAGTSPISALRAACDQLPGSESPPQKVPPNHRAPAGSKSSLKSGDGPPVRFPRRTSVTFHPPFKAGSLSSSPAAGLQVSSSSGTSLGRASNTAVLPQARNRSLLTSSPQQALETPPLPNETAIASSTSSSPKPASITRYSSSFGNRRSRFSSGGGSSKTDDDNQSSGRGSASSARRGSAGMNEGDTGSSGSVQTDEDNIADFIKLLESKKELKSFRTDSVSREEASKRTTAAYNKFSRMRDSTAQLSESISRSELLYRSSVSSSRHLSNVPPMLAGTSISTSSSPGKPISPHTPHTPAIPSRLSANSIIDYSAERSRSHGRGDELHGDNLGDGSGPNRASQVPNAINIPVSPRPFQHFRRASSISQHQVTEDDDEDEDVLPFAIRNDSPPNGSHPPQVSTTAAGILSPKENDDDTATNAEYSTPPESGEILEAREGAPLRSPRPAFHSRFRGLGRGLGSAHGSSSSLGVASAGGSGSGTSESGRGGRFSFSSRFQTGDEDEPEPLLFAMSGINRKND
ncbi:autophagy protein 13 [Elasticomyces elasticus]|nr:autophagy protein 13 [Elasticomyces elasticus]